MHTCIHDAYMYIRDTYIDSETLVSGLGGRRVFSWLVLSKTGTVGCCMVGVAKECAL